MLADTYLGTKVVHGFGLHVLLFSVLCYFVWIIPYQNIERKLFWLFFTVYEFFALITYVIIQYEILHKYSQVFLIASWGVIDMSGAGKLSLIVKNIQDITIPVFMFLCGYILYHKIKKFDQKESEELNKEDVFILFQYPKNIIGLVLSIFWKYPVSTVSLYVDGYKYGFIRKTKSFQKIKFNNIESENYFIKNTYIHKKCLLTEIESLIGTKWSLSLNCLNFYNPLIGAI